MDIGCHEFETGLADSDGDGLPDTWELGYVPGLGSQSYHGDWDDYGFRDGDELHAGTSPLDPASFLGIRALAVDPSANTVVLRWSSTSNRSYIVRAGANLVGSLDTWLADHLPSTPPENTFTDSVHGVDMRIYQIELENGP